METSGSVPAALSPANRDSRRKKRRRWRRRVLVPPPAVPAACLAAFAILESEPDRIERLWSNRRRFVDNLTAAGFSTGSSETPIVPIMVGEARDAFEFSRRLFEAAGEPKALWVVPGAGHVDALTRVGNRATLLAFLGRWPAERP